VFFLKGPARKPAPEPAPAPAVAAAPRPDAAARAELDAISEQVGQARRILSDAIQRLDHGFGALDAEAKNQRQLLENLLSSLAEGGERGAADNLSFETFAVETASVLQQFTDLLAQVSKESVKTVYRVDDMSKELDGIFALLASVDDISTETDMLAVNAAIEAAHAGSKGNSFTVIAGNVRELSKRTRTFNQKIGEQVGRARVRVDEVRSTMSEMASRDLNLALSGKDRVQKMLAQLANFESFLHENMKRAEGGAARIASATSTSITALQFEDILSQLLAGIGQRVAHLRDGTQAPGTTDAGIAPAKVRDVVKQESMTPGDVELF
jgi:methyl-accepting chemotaxis protein